MQVFHLQSAGAFLAIVSLLWFIVNRATGFAFLGTFLHSTASGGFGWLCKFIVLLVRVSRSGFDWMRGGATLRYLAVPALTGPGVRRFLLMTVIGLQCPAAVTVPVAVFQRAAGRTDHTEVFVAGLRGPARLDALRLLSVEGIPPTPALAEAVAEAIVAATEATGNEWIPVAEKFVAVTGDLPAGRHLQEWLRRAKGAR